MGKKIVAISLMLVMVLSFNACAKEPSAEEIVDGVIEAFDDVRTYEFDMDMTLDMAGEAEGETFEAAMVMDASGALDLENRQMKMDITMNMAVPEEDEMEVGMEMYLIGDMVYMLIDIPEVGPMWIKSEMPEEMWEQMNQVEPQIALLETAQVKKNVSEIVNGVDCYVLELTPDMEQIWQLVMQQAELAEGEIPEVAEEFMKEMFRSISVKQWIAKDTYFLMKVEVDLDVELTSEAMGFPEEEGSMTMDIALDLLMYNYNELVSIVLPPEAEEAIEVPME